MPGPLHDAVDINTGRIQRMQAEKLEIAELRIE
jgi:hypothetical protein